MFGMSMTAGDILQSASNLCGALITMCCSGFCALLGIVTSVMMTGWAIRAQLLASRDTRLQYLLSGLETVSDGRSSDTVRRERYRYRTDSLPLDSERPELEPDSERLEWDSLEELEEPVELRRNISREQRKIETVETEVEKTKLSVSHNKSLPLNDERDEEHAGVGGVAFLRLVVVLGALPFRLLGMISNLRSTVRSRPLVVGIISVIGFVFALYILINRPFLPPFLIP